MGIYEIAKIKTQLNFIHNDLLKNRFNKYITNNNDDLNNVQLKINVIAREHLELPKGKFIFKCTDRGIISLGNEKMCRYQFDRKGKILTNVTYYDNYYSIIDINLLQDMKHEGMELVDWEYMYAGLAFNDMVLRIGGLILHGSAIAYKNNGIIFSANSGVGKSTHTSLWRNLFKDDVKVINDDKPVIYFDDDQPIIYGSPWSGISPLNENIKVPLKAIVFIERDSKNWIEKIDVKEKLFRLTGQIHMPYYDEMLCKKALDFVKNLILNIPIYCLHCNMENEAVKVVYKEILGRNENEGKARV